MKCNDPTCLDVIEENSQLRSIIEQMYIAKNNDTIFEEFFSKYRELTQSSIMGKTHL